LLDITIKRHRHQNAHRCTYENRQHFLSKALQPHRPENSHSL